MIWVNGKLYHGLPWLCAAVAVVAVLVIESPVKWPLVVYLAGYSATVLRLRFL